LLKGGINIGIKVMGGFSSIEIGGNYDLLTIALMNIALEVKNDAQIEERTLILCIINTNNIF
jgi:hypothetical protein